MTTEIAPYQGGEYGAVQQFQQTGLDTGLDDFGIEELRTPRLKIDHLKGVYKDPQTNAEFPGFGAVVLGMVKQRVMWDGEDVEGNNNDVPKCKSNDFQRGMPNVDPTSLRQFPWEESSFRRELAVADPNLGRVMLPCATCTFKDWRTRPGTNDRKPPRCSEVWNLILMYDPYNNGALQPAFLALKKSAIAGAKTYLAQFKQQGTAAYVKWTWFTLQQESRGTVTFAKPVLQAYADTDPTAWPQYSANYARLAEFVKSVRPLANGAQQGVQQVLDVPEFTQSQQGVQQGAVPQTVAQTIAQPQAAAPAPAPAQEPPVYTPVPMNQQPQHAAPPVQQSVQYAQPQAPAAVPLPPAPQPTPPAPPVQQAPPQPPAPAPAPQAVTPPPPAPPVQAAPPVAPPPPAPAAPAPVSPPPAPAPAPAAPPAPPVQASPPPAPAPSPAPAAPPAPQAAAPAEPTWSGGGDSLDDDELPF